MRTARADEVERTILRLGLQHRVDVQGIEAQYLGHDDVYRESFDVVVARAFGPSSLTAECAAGLVRVGGVFIVSEPPVDAWRRSPVGFVGRAEPRVWGGSFGRTRRHPIRSV